MSSLPGHAPLLVLVSGYPGAGKSTMAERIAATCSATVASFDWLMSAIRADADTWAIAEAPVERQRSIGWSLLARVAEQQLRIGGKCVVDVVAHETYRRELAALAARYGAQFVVVECVCSDEAVHA
jgi:predicted kinase